MINLKKQAIIVEKNADMLTPIGIFKRLTGVKKFLLESSFQHETKGNYSFIGMDPYQEIRGYEYGTEIFDLKTGGREIIKDNALDYLKTHLPQFESPIPLPFTGGAVGYVAYDAIRQKLDIGETLPDEIDTPDFHFMIYDTIIAYEHRSEKAYIIINPIEQMTDEQIQEKISRIETALKSQVDNDDPRLSGVIFKPSESKASFIKKIEKAKAHIAAGQASQIVISQRLVADFPGDPFSFYRQLRSANPSPYMFYIEFEDYKILGASPESLVQVTGRTVTTNPIAGTKPRGKTEAEDTKIAADLLKDKKEIHEHDLLVDFSKADFKKICQADTIEVPVYKKILRYEHVMHIVSEVQGTLKEDLSSFDAFMNCLPAGTVSGSPKKRAMEIINDIEDVKRGFYAGGLGYFSYQHDLNFAITIRSVLIKNKKAYLQAGAGIVDASIPEKEYEETLHKTKSLTNL